MPAPWRIALERRTGVLFTQLTRDLSLVRAHSVRDAEVSTRQRSYPLVLMRAGLAALTADYTALAEDPQVTAMGGHRSLMRHIERQSSFSPTDA